MASEPDKLFQSLNPYKTNPNLIFNRLYANVLLSLDIPHADEVIEWLLNHPPLKFRVGND